MSCISGWSFELQTVMVIGAMSKSSSINGAGPAAEVPSGVECKLAVAELSTLAGWLVAALPGRALSNALLNPITKYRALLVQLTTTALDVARIFVTGWLRLSTSHVT